MGNDTMKKEEEEGSKTIGTTAESTTATSTAATTTQVTLDRDQEVVASVDPMSEDKTEQQDIVSKEPLNKKPRILEATDMEVIEGEKESKSGLPGTITETTTTCPTETMKQHHQQQQQNVSTSKHIRSKKVDPKVLDIRRRIQLSCRENDLGGAMKVYEEAVDADIRLEAQSFYSLLNLCDGLERTIHVGTPKVTTTTTANTTTNTTTATTSDVLLLNTTPSPIDNRTRQEYAFRIKDHMMKLQLPLNETAYTAIVKVLVRNEEFQMAEEILMEAESIQQCKPRLRLYTSLLVAYCEQRQTIMALKCWYRIVIQQKLDLTEKEFLALLKCAIATGDVPIVERVLSDLAEWVTVPSKDTVSAILEWFESSHSLIHSNPLRIPKHANEEQVKNLLLDIHKDEVEPPPYMGPIQTEKGWRSSSSVVIDPQTGILLNGCLEHSQLKPVPLSDRAWNEMLAMNETIVLEGKVEGNISEFQGGRKGQRRTDYDPSIRRRKWNEFTEYLQQIGPMDVVIDGANVGYFKQNFISAPKHVDYDQIDWIIRTFQEQGKKVLLILHERHFHPKLMPSTYRPLQQEWERMGILYKTPINCNDDWFWLHAALKYRTLVLTNDEMRDHHFQMLSPRIFLRWKERHQVHFSFGEWETSTTTTNGSSSDDNNNDNTRRRRGRHVELTFPLPYSRRIQRVEEGKGLVIPLSKKGDENRFLDGAHVANEDEPIEETYLCIRAISP